MTGLWFPRWLSFLSGLPEASRKSRVVVLIQAYVDESGGKGQGTVFLFSALIGSALIWSRFSDRWKACLDEHPKIKYFKMNEAAQLRGQFERFSKPQRDKKLAKLCEIISSAVLVELHCAVKLDDFTKTLGKHSNKPMTHPYFFPFYVIVLGVGYQLLDWGHKEPYEIFFDENVIFGPKVKAWYPVVRATMEDKLRAIAPVEPFFRSDEDTLPLQAADLTAWLHRRENNEGLGEFKWVEQALGDLYPSPLSNQFTLERMTPIVDKSYSPEILARRKAAIEVYKETFGDHWPPRKTRGKK